MNARVPFAFLLALALSGCATRSNQVRSNALEFLYPNGSAAAPAGDVTLEVPARVGIAFPPAKYARSTEFPEDRKQQLLEKVAAAFRGHEDIASVEVIPTTYLRPEGGFEDLDRVAAGFGIDLVTLVSYDQVQFSDSTGASLAYWTLVGAYVVKGEKNETRTMLDAAVFDLKSRALLFNASGRSAVGGSSTPIKVDKALRTASDQGFAAATDDLIKNLETALAAFQEQAAKGTVRGVGTPAIALVDPQGQPLPPGEGAGALGAVELSLALLLLACRACGRRAARSSS
ncbi:MAG TPA: rhombotarget lipoprotein [Candidatus Polarisedimenticolaceae bacterium]|nr:rhombotarget lipoprotein [Candidatus Polarisedimenticolaceae bacterium]